MATDFGLSTSSICDMLEIVGKDLPLVQKLVDFLQQKFPPGFPTQIKMPVAPTVTATVTFKDFRESQIDSELFAMPPNGYYRSNYYRPWY
jgi:hypothetical protein